MSEEATPKPASAGWKRNVAALIKSMACLYLPFVWVLPSCSYMRPWEVMVAFSWFPGLVPALSWWGRDNYWAGHSLAVTALFLFVLFFIFRRGGRLAKFAAVITIGFALLMSLIVRHILLV